MTGLTAVVSFVFSLLTLALLGVGHWLYIVSAYNNSCDATLMSNCLVYGLAWDACILLFFLKRYRDN